MVNLEPNPVIEPAAEPRLASREAWQTEISQRRQIGEVALSNIQEPLTVRNLDDQQIAFDALTNLIHASSKTKEEADELMQYIEEIKINTPLDHPVVTGNPFTEKNADKISPLVDIRPVVMADPRVQELINNRDISESHQELLDVWPSFTEAYTHGVRAAVELGYIPKSAQDRLETALAKTSVRVMDGAVLDIYGSLTAYYSNDDDEVAVRHDIRASGENIQDSLAHEITHKLSGGTFKAPNASATEFVRSRVGFSTELKRDDLNRTGLNEAVTHHVTLGILSGDFETLDPDERGDQDSTYYDYRKIFAEFVGRSKGLINIKTITNAFFEDTGTDGGIEARRKLIREVSQAYGRGALSRLDKLMDLTDMIGSNHIEALILSRIHPPALGEKGQMIKKGYIDTQNLPTFFDVHGATKETSGNI